MPQCYEQGVRERVSHMRPAGKNRTGFRRSAASRGCEQGRRATARIALRAASACVPMPAAESTDRSAEPAGSRQDVPSDDLQPARTVV